MQQGNSAVLKIIEDHADRLRAQEDCIKTVSIQLATLSQSLNHTNQVTSKIECQLDVVSDKLDCSLRKLEDMEAQKAKRTRFWENTRYRILIPLLLAFTTVFIAGAAGGIWAFLLG